MSFSGHTSSDDEDFKKVTEANFQKIRSKSTKIGYLDGVSDGHEQSFQTAFDQGYADGLRAGFELEKYRAFFDNLSTLNNQNEELNKEKLLYLNIGTDSSQYRFSEQNKEPLSTISNHQNCYVNTCLGQCEQTLPLSTNLLASQNVE
ncbi:uncharacterized protein LOC129241152 [Anastrepha obliqua]|uniref:uncharacterized protein LOC129241152 n=1 Tax=Anastrepha obliqua TaxID=95512 RepID=UPI00240A59FE|nr:uncharacterized protein LOC129241152 [Anastrepha obliqua]